jgi:putative transposase
VTQRGSRRLPTFFSANDYRRYLTLLRRAADREAVELLVHTLMPNHVHLIVVPGSPGSLSRALYRAHRRYAEEINTRLGWCGHFFQERFSCCAMDERHARNAVRYVLLNPVRAGLARAARDWPWSNARELIEGPATRMTELHLPAGEELAQLLEEPPPPSFGEAFHDACRTGRPLGDDPFIEDLERTSGRTLRRQRLGRRPRIVAIPPDSTAR